MIARLTDATLQGLMPGGPYFDIGAKGQTAMVVVSLNDDDASQMFHGAASIRTVYAVRAVELETSGSRVQDAAARIYQLLQWDDDSPPPLTIAGFDVQALRRIKRIRYTEVDTTNADQRWQIHGGLYEVIVAPRPAARATTSDATADSGEEQHGSTTR